MSSYASKKSSYSHGSEAEHARTLNKAAERERTNNLLIQVAEQWKVINDKRRSESLNEAVDRVSGNASDMKDAVNEAKQAVNEAKEAIENAKSKITRAKDKLRFLVAELARFNVAYPSGQRNSANYTFKTRELKADIEKAKSELAQLTDETKELDRVLTVRVETYKALEDRYCDGRR